MLGENNVVSCQAYSFLTLAMTLLCLPPALHPKPEQECCNDLPVGLQKATPVQQMLDNCMAVSRRAGTAYIQDLFPSLPVWQVTEDAAAESA